MSLRHALLGLLVDRTASGYDLLKLFDTSLAHVWPATQSQVYGELTRLADAGLLEVVGQGPRGRKDYALTDTGMTELHRWLADPPPEQPRRSDTLLRVFFLDVLTPQQRLAFLNHQAERAAGHHAALRQLRDSLDWTEEGMLTANGLLTLEYGLRLTAMQEEWARWAAQLVASSDSPSQARQS
ncbi:PadR family transcriptional regulator [Actinacidiphila soli]|uniref:PadR family transcriptional regulator n=1 Tax=Actinacidiphila soli TaxID=2487275 RepID=UPI000FCB913C|nr:PadR family transcriptional regulator [Actinacidiphila soli]